MIKRPGFPSNVLRSPLWVYGTLPFLEDYLYDSVQTVLLSGTATTRSSTQANFTVTIRLSSVVTSRVITFGNITHVPVVSSMSGSAQTRIATSGELTVEGFGVRLARATLIDETQFYYFTVQPQ